MFITKNFEFRPYYYTNWAKQPIKQYLKSWLCDCHKSNMLDIYTHYQLRFIGITFAYRVWKRS